MEFAKNILDWINKGGSTALNIIQVGGFWVITISAYLEMSKSIPNQDIPKTIASIIKHGALIIILFKVRPLFVWLSKL